MATSKKDKSNEHLNEYRFNKHLRNENFDKHLVK